MPHDTLTPVFVGLRAGLHVLFAALLALVVVRAVIARDDTLVVELMLAAGFAVLYVLGARISTVRESRRASVSALWIAALTVVWVALLALVPEAAYLAFPLFFLYLHVLPKVIGPAAVVVATTVAIVALGLHSEFTVGGVVGPIVGAGVAVLIGIGYRALAREAAEREALVAELIATRDRLAAAEREQGILAERGRLAREIHDTVAQGLSSIQLLLHAAEAADGERPGIEHVRLARTTAADGLADTRRFIRELAPPSLDDGLSRALHRLTDRWQSGDLAVVVTTPETDVDLPMDAQTALLRIAQGAVANVAQHAHASTAFVTLCASGRDTILTVSDNGVGFDPVTAESRSGSSGSFGLLAIAERVEQLNGALRVDSKPGEGTTLTVRFPEAAT